MSKIIYKGKSRDHVQPDDILQAQEKGKEEADNRDWQASKKAGKEINAHYLYSTTFEITDGYLGFRNEIRSTPFDRIRRITGYLVGTTDRFNDAKLAEVRDRVKHTSEE